MLVMEQIGKVKAKGQARVLKLNRETLRELGAPKLCPGATFHCITDKCTQGCGNTKKC